MVSRYLDNSSPVHVEKLQPTPVRPLLDESPPVGLITGRRTGEYSVYRQNQKQIYYQEGFYTTMKFVLTKKVHTLKTINNTQTMTLIYKM